MVLYVNLYVHTKHAVSHMFTYSQPWLAWTSDTSNRSPIRLYLGLGPVCATFCQTSDRGIRCPRYLIPRIWSVNFCQWHSEVHKYPLPPARHPPPLARAPFTPSPERVPPAPYWGHVLRIPWIPRIEGAACPRYPQLICILTHIHELRHRHFRCHFQLYRYEHTERPC